MISRKKPAADKPLLGITLGDPAGIGPEVAIAAVASSQVQKVCRPLLIGDERIVRRAAQWTGCDWEIVSITPETEKSRTLEIIRGKKLFVLHTGDAPPQKIPVGRLSSAAGRAAYSWVRQGALLALKNRIDALVTAPLNKEAVLKAGIEGFTGHTELLAELSGAKSHAMMLAGGNLRVTLVTTHLALEQVPRSLTASAIRDKILLTQAFLLRLGIAKPRLAVTALNPHGGEGGAFGDEESRIILPAVRAVRRKGLDVQGPFPADTLFARHCREPFDAIIVMYHDQGLIPLKLLSFGKGVNITLGLPFIRTSPDHGTAFEIAGKAMANPGSMIEAILLAAKLASGDS